MVSRNPVFEFVLNDRQVSNEEDRCLSQKVHHQEPLRDNREMDGLDRPEIFLNGARYLQGSVWQAQPASSRDSSSPPSYPLPGEHVSNLNHAILELENRRDVRHARLHHKR